MGVAGFFLLFCLFLFHNNLLPLSKISYTKNENFYSTHNINNKIEKERKFNWKQSMDDLNNVFKRRKYLDYFWYEPKNMVIGKTEESCYWAVAPQIKSRGATKLGLNTTNSKTGLLKEIPCNEAEWRLVNKTAHACPHCIDNNNIFVTCSEEDEKLVRYSDCVKTQKPLSYCPENFTQSSGECCLILDKAPYNESVCPYNYQKTFSSIKCKPNEPIWFPAIRNMSYGIGQFYNLDINNYYNIITPVDYNTNISDSNCLVYNKGTLIGVSCDEKYKRVCAYNFLHQNNQTYCQQGKKRADRCMNTNFETNRLTCFCREDASKENCNLAEFLLPYQNTAALETFDGCEIGLKYRNNSTLVWERTNTPANYTNWFDFQKQSHGIVIMVFNRWLFSDLSFGCKICEETFDYKIPSIQISNENGIIKVALTNINSFVKSDAGHSIFCFTDGYPNYLIRMVANSSSVKNSLNFNAYIAGRYWCEALEIVHFNKIRSNVLTIGNDLIFYSVEITCKYNLLKDPTTSEVAYDECIKMFEIEYNEKFIELEAKWMKTSHINESKGEVTYLMHLSSNSSRDYMTMYYYISKNLETSYFKEFKFGKLRNTRKCMRDVTYINNNRLTWFPIDFSEDITANETCLNENDKPILRTCDFNYLDKAIWSKCQPCYTYSRVRSDYTTTLIDLLHSNACVDIIVQNLTTIIDVNSTDFEPIDIYIISSILFKVNSIPESLHNITEILPSVTEILSKIMSLHPDILKESQREWNTTDRILDSLDSLIEICKFQSIDNILIEKENLIISITDANRSNISGIALTNTKGSYNVIKLYPNDNQTTIKKIEGLQAATYVPIELFNKISLQSNDSKIVTILFLKETLFNEDCSDCTYMNALRKSVALTLPKIDNDIPLPIIYKSNNNLENFEKFCSFWNYGKEAFYRKGSWLAESLPSFYENDMYICEHPHLTHFSFLLSDLIQEDPYYNIVTILETALASFGFFGVFFTAILFKNWRRNEGNKILLHFCAASYMQVIMLNVSPISYGSFAACVTVGSILHYLVICSFLWMLVIAVIQHKRFVKVLEAPQQWIVTKSPFICYTLPSIPVFSLLTTSHEEYINDVLKFCYPKGYALIYTVLMPVGLIVIANTIIFGHIFLEILCKKNRSDLQEIGLKVKLLLLLFFLLGVTWIFGFVALIFEDGTIMGIFDFLAPLQGFVVFLFFIVFNKNVRQRYVKRWRM